jgi:superfamily II DNA or RNA helicase
MSQTFSPGALVRLRDREWIVMPSADPDVLRIKPLGGHEIESTGIYLPLALPHETPEPAEFPMPGPEDLADFDSAQLLYDAARLGLRTGAGPFRSFGRLSVRPRPYQLVPLIMALRQEIVRLLIADDVGVGKTIEALLIVREMVDRGLIERFAVVCPAHLCDQWETEAREKFGFDDVQVIRTDTAARLDRRIQGDESVFRHYPFQIISIDYIKSERRRQLFIAECPEMVVVDEAHTCTLPRGATSHRQQQRHFLVHKIAQKARQHLLLLTATPHSGIEESFQSLLAFLDSDFEDVVLSEAPRKTRERVARHVVQRRRRDIAEWMEHTDFPERIAEEAQYPLSPDYQELFDDVLRFARGYAGAQNGSDGPNGRGERMRYWTALAILRGVISSPAAGEMMLRNRAEKVAGDAGIDDDTAAEALFDADENQADTAPTELTESAEFAASQVRQLQDFADRLADLRSGTGDWKLRQVRAQLEELLDEGYQPIVFCRYIPTANYLEDRLRQDLEDAYPGIAVEAVTSELNDDQRTERVDAIGQAERRVLIATDCLSEGINLQEHFTAVIHYDLPWNPNRIEQREGRVDRYGQAADRVKTVLMVGENPIDGVITRVLLRKTRKIHEETGIALPFPEDSQTVTEAITQAVLMNPEAAAAQNQLTLGLEAQTVQNKESEVKEALDRALQRETNTRGIFAQNRIQPEEIEPDLKETDRVLGSPDAVERFVRRFAAHQGAQMDPRQSGGETIGYRLYPGQLPPALQEALPEGECVDVTFRSPVPDGFTYLGRNHAFVEQACQHVMRRAFNGDAEDDADGKAPARAAVVRTEAVDVKTTLVLFRIRNVIRAAQQSEEIVAEEVMTWGYRGLIDERDELSREEARRLLLEITPSSNVSPESQEYFLDEELDDLAEAEGDLESITRERTQALIDAHERHRRTVGGSRYEGVDPIWPPDVLGLYVLLPE